MKTVREAISAVSSLLSAQNINWNEQYRCISFCIIENINGVFVAYNSLTGEVVELSEAEVEIIKNDSVFPSEKSKELIEKWFLVPVNHNDVQLCEELRGFLKLVRREIGINKYTIFTTTDCNARCFYCFEAGRPRTHMSEEVALKTAEFIINNCDNKKASLGWFGGEPLYNTKVIDIITTRLAEAGVEFTSMITTNGYLFEQDIVEKACEKWKVKKIQITLDGTEKVYNKAKAYINAEGKNPFAIVTDNIERLLKKGVKVIVRMNMGSYNKEDLFKLVEWLSERYKGYNTISAYPFLLFDENSNSPLDHTGKMPFAMDLIALEKYCIEKNILVKEGLDKSIRVSKCMADSISSITITPTGNIGKCEHFSENEFVGSLDEGITNLEKLAEFSEKGNNAELCKGCPVYPVCIELKKCPDRGSEICNDAKRYIAEEHMRRKLRNTYCKLKNNKKESLSSMS